MQILKRATVALALALVGSAVVSSASVSALSIPKQDVRATNASISMTLLPNPALAATDLKSDACAGLQQLDNTKKCDGKDAGVESLVKSVVSILSYLVGIAAVIMVIIAGLKYVTASGDPSNISSAKNTLLYALIGLFIAALAQFLVHFVLSTANK